MFGIGHRFGLFMGLYTDPGFLPGVGVLILFGGDRGILLTGMYGILFITGITVHLLLSIHTEL